ncbi:MAG: helix-turn-helix transcriptional regulator [Clostridiaceae bacterium]|nr:helix-turn-helix transcriptional regulator [Clostridiaceae bacterium]
MSEDSNDTISSADEALLIQVVSDPTRIQIMKTLSENGPMCGKSILSFFTITQPTLSHHMSLLCSSGLVDSKKEGKFVVYKICPAGVKTIVLFFEKLISEEKKLEPGETRNIKASSKKPSLIKTPMLPKLKTSVPSPEIPSDTIIEGKKIKNKDKGKDSKKEKKKKKKK